MIYSLLCVHILCTIYYNKHMYMYIYIYIYIYIDGEKLYHIRHGVFYVQYSTYSNI